MRCRRAGVVIDLLFDYSAVDVVRAKAQRDLRDLGGHHLPVGLDVREVVEQQTADGDLFDIREPRGSGQVRQRGVIGMKGQRDEGLKAVRIILQGAKLQQVIDAIFVVLDVSVEHGGI